MPIHAVGTLDGVPWQLRCRMKHGFSDADRRTVESMLDATPGVDRVGWQPRRPPILVVLTRSEDATKAIVNALAGMPFAGEVNVGTYERNGLGEAEDDSATVAEPIPPAPPERE